MPDSALPRVVVSVTEAGRAVANRIAGDHVHGSLAATIRDRWERADAIVAVAATGAVVRVIAPLLRGKDRDPAVVCVDDGGRFVIPLVGGHRGGANALARALAAHLGAVAVVTTASERAGVPVLDDLDGFATAGDIATVQRALIDGEPVAFTADPEVAAYRVVVIDRQPPPATERPAAYLHPPSLVVGVGASAGAPVEEVAVLVDRALTGAGLAHASVGEVATIDIKAEEPAIVALGLPMRLYRAAELRAVPVPTPSVVVEDAVGTPSVAEAAALLAAGPDGELLVTKQVSAHATVAVARRARPRGRLMITGLGPGDPRLRAPAATVAVRDADVVIGYRPYVAACRDLVTPRQEVIESPIGDEVIRAKQALAEAEAGRRVALVCSGDAGVYAMASLVLEMAGVTDCDIEVVPGITAATAAAALLGAPLGHDHAAVSLSDLLTPWPVIAARLEAAAAADFVVSLYNPRSHGRPDHLDGARAIFLQHRDGATPVGVVTDAYRPGQRVTVTTLADLDPAAVGMTSIVVIGASTTVVREGRMVTPRGYEP
jgi:cobalt-precorrin 5A hydrolase/precorrin-3B C17-methyltransferase